MRRLLTLLLVLVLSLSLLPVQAYAADDAPQIEGSAAVIYISDNNSILYKKKCETKMNPASMTKLVTCYLAIEELGLDTKVTVDAAACAVKRDKETVVEGEEISVKDLVYQAMLISANDSATALAIAVSGSESEFVDKMNKQVKEWGCKTTKFKTASGVYVDGQYSTCKDIAIIASKVFQNESLREIAGTASYTVAATNKTEEEELSSYNLFLEGGSIDYNGTTIKVDKYSGVFGGKTGTTSDEKANMVVGCSIEGMDVYAVVMGSTPNSRYSDIKELLDYADKNIDAYQAFSKGDVVGTVKVKGGATNRLDLVAGKDGTVILPEGASASLVTYEVETDGKVTAPVKKGELVGKIRIYVADDLVRTMNARAANDVQKGWFLSGLGITNFQTVIIFAVLFLILLGYITILRIRARNRKKREARRKARLRAMAKSQIEQEEDWNRRGWTYHK